MRPPRLEAISWLLLAGLAACGPASSSGGAPAEQVRRTLLHHQQVKRHSRLFFVGIAEADGLEQATRTAYDEITSQLDWLPAGDRRLLEGLYRVDRTITDADGRVHLLAVLERQAASEHLQRLARQQRGELSIKLDEVRRRKDAADLKAARVALTQAQKLVRSIRELLAAARAAVGDPPRPASFPEQQRTAELAGQLDAIGTRSRVVLLHVTQEVDGKPDGDLDATLGQLVSQQGFRLAQGSLSQGQVQAALSGDTRVAAHLGRNAGAGYVIVGQVAAKFSSEDSGQYFAWARSRLRLIETAAGRTVGELHQEQIKGGHISRKKACERAIHNALERLSTALKAKLATL